MGEEQRSRSALDAAQDGGPGYRHKMAFGYVKSNGESQNGCALDVAKKSAT
jgi:hypothetical protein